MCTKDIPESRVRRHCESVRALFVNIICTCVTTLHSCYMRMPWFSANYVHWYFYWFLFLLILLILKVLFKISLTWTPNSDRVKMYTWESIIILSSSHRILPKGDLIFLTLFAVIPTVPLWTTAYILSLSLIVTCATILTWIAGAFHDDCRRRSKRRK